MSKYRDIFSNATGGEITPHLSGRFDLERFKNSWSLLRNFIVRPYGGIRRRGGRLTIDRITGDDWPTAMVEFNGEYNESIVLAITDHMPSLGLSGKIFFVRRQAVIMGEGEPLSVSHTFSSAKKIRTAQHNDVLYMVGPGSPPKKLVRYGELNWVLEDAEFYNGPFEEPNQDSYNIVEYSGNFGAVTLRSQYPLFEASHVGQEFRVGPGVAVVTAFTSDTEVSANITKEIQYDRYTGGLSREILSGAWNVDSEGSAGCVSTNEATEIEAGDSAEVHKVFELFYGRKYKFDFLLEVLDSSGDPVDTHSASVNVVCETYDKVKSGWDFDTSTVCSNGANTIDGYWILEPPFTYTDPKLVPSSNDRYYEKPLDQDYNSADAYSFTLSLGDYQHGDLPMTNNCSKTSYAWPSDPINVKAYLRLSVSGVPASGTVKISKMTFREVEPNQNINATADWAFMSFPASASQPETIAFRDSRLVLTRGNEMWFSSLEESHENFDAYDQELDTSGFFIKLKESKREDIQWAVMQDAVFVGTNRGIWKVFSDDGVLTASTVKAKKIVEAPTCSIPPILCGNDILFVSADKRRVFKMAYALDKDGYAVNDISIFSEHLFSGRKIASIQYDGSSNHLLWVMFEDGDCCCATFFPEQNVVAWTSVEFASGRGTSIVTAKGPEDEDAIFFSVRHDVSDGGGVYETTVEMLQSEWGDRTEQCFLDEVKLTEADEGSLTAQAEAPHLIGKTVSVFANGMTYDDQVVPESGVVPLERNGVPDVAAKIYVGLPYESRAESQRIAVPTREGHSAGRNMRILRVNAIMENSGPGTFIGCISPEGEERLEEVPRAGLEKDTGAYSLEPLISDYVEVSPASGYYEDSRVVVTHEEASPCNITAIVFDIEEGE